MVLSFEYTLYDSQAKKLVALLQVSVFTFYTTHQLLSVPIWQRASVLTIYTIGFILREKARCWLPPNATPALPFPPP